MIQQKYAITQVPLHWTEIIKRVEQGHSIQLTRNYQVVARLVPTQFNQRPTEPQPNFWQALQTFRQQVDMTNIYDDEEIFSDIRDRSQGREVLL